MQNFTPFPLRARGSLEIFDAAIKLYKQYFWVLLGWSAIVWGASVFSALLPFGTLASWFVTPLAIGSVVCCVAAAVRGQNVEFGQCWRFTQPRYWTMLGMFILSLIIAFIIGAVLVGILVGIFMSGVLVFQQSSGAIQLVMSVLGFVVLGSLGTITSILLTSWMGLVPIVVCMEEDKRGTIALGRAYDILRGHWGRIVSIVALVALAMIAFFAILAGLASAVVGVGTLRDMMEGNSLNNTALWLGVAAMGLAYTVLWIIWTPLYYLILSVFYLDVRVRQEGLDLEWTAHVTAPQPEPYNAAQPPFIPQPEYSSPAGMHPAGMPPAVTPLAPIAPPAPTLPTESGVTGQTDAPVESNPLPAPVSPPVPGAPTNPYNTQRLNDVEFDATNAVSSGTPYAPDDTNTSPETTSDRPQSDRPSTPW